MVFAVSRPHSYAHFQIQCKRKRVFVAQVGPNTFSHRPRDPMRSGGETYRRFRSSRSGAQARGWGSGGGPSARHTGRRSRIHDCWLSECCTVPAAGWSKASLILGGVRCPRGVTLDGMDIALICWTAMLKVCEGGGQAATGRQGDRLGGWAGACPITGQIFGDYTVRTYASAGLRLRRSRRPVTVGYRRPRYRASTAERDLRSRLLTAGRAACLATISTSMMA